MSAQINVTAAEKNFRILGYVMLGGVVGSLFLIFFLAFFGHRFSPGGATIKMLIVLKLLFRILAWVGPIFIGIVAHHLGKNGILWGILTFILTPIAQIVAYFWLKSNLSEVAAAEANWIFQNALAQEAGSRRLSEADDRVV